MSSRTASVLVCDDILFGMNGKVVLQGVYAADINIPGREILVPQLVFYFSVQTPKTNRFKRVTLKVTPPGGTNTLVDLPISETPPAAINAERPLMIIRAPVLVQYIMLRPGKIETTVITENEEIDAGGVWVSAISPSPQPHS